MPFISKSTLKLTKEQLDVTLNALRNEYNRAPKMTQHILKDVIAEVAVGGSAQNVRGPGKKNAQPKKQSRKKVAKRKYTKKSAKSKDE
jgi:hypothetical protein